MDEKRAPGGGELAHEMGFNGQVPGDVNELAELLSSLLALGISILQVKPETRPFPFTREAVQI